MFMPCRNTSIPKIWPAGTVVVIDVLRAATTIVYALEAGAEQILPCLEIADALALAERFSPDEVVLGGEREGSLIEGFDLGNSPDEYTSERVGGKTVIFDHDQRHPSVEPRPIGRRSAAGRLRQRRSGRAAAGRPRTRPYYLCRHRRTNRRR